MDILKVTEFVRKRLNFLFLVVLLLTYTASTFSTRGVGYFFLLFFAALLYVAGGIALYTLFKGDERKTGAFRLTEIAFWIMLCSFFFYFIQIGPVWNKILGEKKSVSLERLRQIFQILYFSGFTIVFLGLLVASTVRLQAKEAPVALTTLGALLVALVALNYWTHIAPAQVDMTLMHRFSLSTDSKQILRGMETNVKVTAFFPFFSDLYRDVELLLRDAVATTGKISYTFIDPLREKDLADSKKVDRIGTILIEAQDTGSETIEGSKVRSTRFEISDSQGLKRLERELVSGILQVSGKPKTIYYTQGHEEKSITSQFNEDSIGTFDETLRALRHHLKKLTPAEGFPQKMPAADLVMILGPRRDFAPIEKKALKEYFDKGGKIFVALDPESSADFSFLLSPLKLKYVHSKLLSDFSLPPGKATLQTSTYGEHAITEIFSKRGEERKLTLFPGAGHFETEKESAPDYDVNFFLMSHYATWIDSIPNGLRDDKKEPIASFKIGLAAQAKKNSGRLVFLADSDFLVNRFIDMQQNKELALRIVGWLTENEKLTGLVPGKYDDEKVKLTGRKDAIVFHLFLYIYPGILLLVGFFIVRQKRKRLSQNKSRGD